jgi:3-oxoacyl-[acyl-carrier-protein] synthase II
MMKTYIRSTGNVSSQKTFGHPPFLTDPVWYNVNRLTCIEPDYRQLIDAKMIRRMSRIIKMGVAAASDCLQEADLKLPGAIITGTAYGCLEDTGVFLSKMVEQREELLTPTAFIQSTHNTVGAQIALMLQCHAYNNTFVHRGFSFESALLDAMMLLQEKVASTVLTGAVDEITDASHAILGRLGLYKKETTSTHALYDSATKGTIAGEGASFFLLSGEPSGNDYATIDAMETLYKPKSFAEISDWLTAFLNTNATGLDDIDLVITGKNGDPHHDEIYTWLSQSLFSKKNTIGYKHLCGEYPTSTAFALWMAANILKSNTVPLAIENTPLAGNKIKRVLIYNQYQGIHHSLLLISAC